MMTEITNRSNEEKWIPIVDYAVLKGISTSTLRRYIKAQKIPFKVENGKYLLKADPLTAAKHELKQKVEANRLEPQFTQDSISVFRKVAELEQQLLRAEEEITELKMLVSLYEEKLMQSGH